MELEKRKQLLRDRINNPTANEIADNERHLAFFMANVYNFLGYLNKEECIEAYKQIMYNNQLSIYEQDDFDSIENTKFDVEAQFEKGESSIIVTTHLGSYRIINSLLMKAGMDFFIIIDDEAYRSQYRSFINSWQKIEKRYQKGSQFEILNVKEPQTFRRTLKYLRNGKTLVVYLDGNSGTEGMTNTAKGISIDFFKNKIDVRKGIGMLAYMSKKPVKLAISNRNESGISIDIHKILPKSTYREEYISEVLNSSYQLFQRYLSDNLWQWEGWLYLHKFINQDDFISTYEPVRKQGYNNARFIPFQMLKEYYLIDVIGYRFHQISYELYKAFGSDDTNYLRTIQQNEYEALLNSAVYNPA